MSSRRAVRILLVVAVAWSVVILAAALWLPVYDSSRTLVEENGNGVLAVMVLPLVASVVVALTSGGGSVARLLAWGATGAVGLLAVLGMLSVGPVIVPVAACLVAVCALDLA